MTFDYRLGDRVSFSSNLQSACDICTIRYVGEVDGFNGKWLGVEWDEDCRGKHDGSLGGRRYFKCLSPSPTAASFVRPSRPADPKRSFLEAVREKYAPGVPSHPQQVTQENTVPIVISGKLAEEIGFDKVRETQSQLDELKIVIVDGMRISVAQKENESIADTCPKIVELDMSRNLFAEFKEVSRICSQLPNMRKLKLSGNRFSDEFLLRSDTHSLVTNAQFPAVTEVCLNEVLLPWNSIITLASHFPSLTALIASSNYLKSLSCSLNHDSLCSLTLDYNEFEYLSDLDQLAKIDSLRNLHLRGNKIAKINRWQNTSSLLQFPINLQYLDLSSNAINSWGFIDELPSVFPGLSGLRLSNNPLFPSVPTESAAPKDDDSFFITVGRLGKLQTLNFSHITPADRTNAEIYYLSQIAKEASKVPEEKIDTVISQHRRFQELCGKWGAPAIVRKKPLNEDPAFLEGRLINFTFRRFVSSDVNKEENIIYREIPKSIDIYRVKGIVAKFFGIPLLNLRLIWETGEWDPVAGYEDKELSSDVEEDETLDGLDHASPNSSEKGRWMEREVEIEDSTRQIGSFVDGPRATVRAEFVP